MLVIGRLLRTCIVIIALLAAVPAHPASPYLLGRVVDAATGHPLSHAKVTTGGKTCVTDPDGLFCIARTDGRASIRASGYRRSEVQLAEAMTIPLKPFTPKALYLSFYGIGSQTIMNRALDLIESTELNAVVVDVKGDRGMIPYRSGITLAGEVGAQRIITVRDMAATVKLLKDRGIYTIARVVTFKDDLVARSKPEWAVKSPQGGLWRDREKLHWLDASIRATWDYPIAVAEEAARLGFDEIQFDYVRFPDTPGLVFSVENTEQNRTSAISGFLAEAARRLAPYDVFVAADIFGYVHWNTNDTKIGQRLEDVAWTLDYLCPMLYPSGFQFGIPGYRNPVKNPYEIYLLTMKRAQARTGLPGSHFRPWLQAFRDYAFDRRRFGAAEIRAQIKACEDFGSNGWMLWNPRNDYSRDGLGSKRD